MRIVQRVIIKASPEVIWPYVADPVMVSAWNPKIVGVERTAVGPVEAGERFAMTYRMTSEVRAEAEVVSSEPPSRVVVRSTMAQGSRTGSVEEIIELRVRAAGTLMTQSIDLSRSGIPVVFQWLMWMIQRWGTPRDTPYLEVLRDLIEEDERSLRSAA